MEWLISSGWLGGSKTLLDTITTWGLSSNISTENVPIVFCSYGFLQNVNMCTSKDKTTWTFCDLQLNGMQLLAICHFYGPVLVFKFSNSRNMHFFRYMQIDLQRTIRQRISVSFSSTSGGLAIWLVSLAHIKHKSIAISSMLSNIKVCVS